METLITILYLVFFLFTCRMFYEPEIVPFEYRLIEDIITYKDFIKSYRANKNLWVLGETYVINKKNYKSFKFTLFDLLKYKIFLTNLIK